MVSAAEPAHEPIPTVAHTHTAANRGNIHHQKTTHCSQSGNAQKCQHANDSEAHTHKCRQNTHTHAHARTHTHTAATCRHKFSVKTVSFISNIHAIMTVHTASNNAKSKATKITPT